MFDYDISSKLKRKLRKMARKDKVLAINFYKKLNEVVSCDVVTIKNYKNLKSPLNYLKRIHLTKNYILLFVVNLEKNHILFMDILHWDTAYKN